MLSGCSNEIPLDILWTYKDYPLATFNFFYYINITNYYHKGKPFSQGPI